jgi:hypothetical protein
MSGEPGEFGNGLAIFDPSPPIESTNVSGFCSIEVDGEFAEPIRPETVLRFAPLRPRGPFAYNQAAVAEKPKACRGRSV